MRSSTLEITIQRGSAGIWPVVVEDHRSGTLLPVRSEGQFQLANEPASSNASRYGTALGQALFKDSVRDAIVRARNESRDSVRVLLFVEADELKNWHWEWLCGPVDGNRWDFLSLEQRVLFSLYLPSLTDRAFPPIGLRDLRALVVLASPADPDNRYGLQPFEVKANVDRLKEIFGERIPCDVLARVPGGVGAPTLEELAWRLTEGSYTILHVVCHGRFYRDDGETVLYLEQATADAQSGLVLARPVSGTALVERLARLNRLPYMVFLSTCESSVPEAEQRLGGLAQRLVRDLGIPAVIGMTERVTVTTAHALAEAFYLRLLAQGKTGEVDRALVEAYAGLASRPDVNVPALYSRLGSQPLFSPAIDRELTPQEIRFGLDRLEKLLRERAPVLLKKFEGSAQKVRPAMGNDPEALTATANQEREEGLKDLNDICQEIVDITFNALAAGEPAPSYDARQPFRGMSPFRAGDEPFFFGREALIQKLEERLTQNNFLAVLGPSGSGKSSLVLAGLVPRLKQTTPELQVIDDLTPGMAPIQQLRVRQEKLKPGPALYIVDQFEELFTLCRDEAQRQQFIGELLKLTEVARVVLTMRADFWGECAPYTALKERMQALQELIGPMTTSELRTAMEQQAAKVGLRFEADLTNTMLDEVAGEPGAMPLLQHTLLELWKSRHGRWLRAEEYRNVGGAKEAIARTAERIYLFPTIDKAALRRIFVDLTQLNDSFSEPGKWRGTRRRVAIAQLVPSVVDRGAITKLISELADNVLVTSSVDPMTGEPMVEMAHEALITYWSRLRGWLESDRRFLVWRDRLNAVAVAFSSTADSSVLLRGRTLAEALRWRKIFSSALTERQHALITASVAAEDRRRSRQLARRARQTLPDDAKNAVRVAAKGLRLAETFDAVFMLRQATAAVADQIVSSYRVWRPQCPIRFIVFNKDSKSLYVGGEDRKCLFKIWSTGSVVWPTIHPVEGDSGFLCGAVSSKGDFLFIGCADSTLRIYDLTSDTLFKKQRYCSFWKISLTRALKVMPFGELLVKVLKLGTHVVNGIAFSPAANIFCTVSSDDTARVWSADGYTLLHDLGPNSGGSRVMFDQSGHRMMTTLALREYAVVWDTSTWTVLEQGYAAYLRDGILYQPSEKAQCCYSTGSRFNVAALSPDGRFVLANSKDNGIQIFELGALITSSAHFFEGQKELTHAHLVVDAQFSPGGERVATVCLDRRLRIWDLHSRRIDIEFGLAADPVGVAWSPSGRWIVVTMDLGEIKAFFVGVFENSKQLLDIADAWLANYIDSAIVDCWANW